LFCALFASVVGTTDCNYLTHAVASMRERDTLFRIVRQQHIPGAIDLGC